MSSDFSAEQGASLPPNDAASALPLADSVAESQQSGLFGRGLLYVVVFSLQTLAATVVSPVLAHLIGPTEFGFLASAIALYQLLTVLAVIGLDQAIVLQRTEDGNGRSARGLLVVSFSVTALVTLILAATGPLWAQAMGFGSFSPLLVATLLWTFAGACVQVMLGLLLAEDRLKLFTIVSALAAVGGQVLGIAFLLLGSNTASTYAWGGVISQCSAMLIAMVATRPRLQGLADLPTIRRAFRLGLPLAIGGLSAFVLNAGDRIVVQRILGPIEVGRYQVAYTIGYVVVLLLVFTSQAWTPRFAAIRDRAERLLLAEQSRNELYRLLMPMILGITLAAPFALRIVAPPSFHPESLSTVVFLVALSAFPVAASGASTRELFTLRQGRAIAVATGAAAVFNIALNIVLVPRLGIAGSAAATVMAFALQAYLQLRAIPRTPPWPRTPNRIWVGVGVVCLLSAGSTLLPQTPTWIALRLLVGLACLPWFVLRLSAARTGSIPVWGVRLLSLLPRRSAS
jgi:O-antigen/teichoic acid export membrane protein